MESMQDTKFGAGTLTLIGVVTAIACAKAQPEDLTRFTDPALWDNLDNSGGQGGSSSSTSHAGSSQASAGQSPIPHTGGTGGSMQPSSAGASNGGEQDAGAEPTDPVEPDGGSGGGPVVVDAGPEQPPTYLSDFSVAYQVEINGPTSSYVGGQLQIWNFGFDTAPLNEFKIRYYYTNEVGMSAMIRINWGNVNNGGAAVQIPSAITVTEHEMDTPNLTSGADYYLEFAFTSSEPLAGNGKATFSFQMDAPPQESYVQMGDYSFDPAMSTLTEWDHIVLYRNGQGAWGVEP